MADRLHAAIPIIICVYQKMHDQYQITTSFRTIITFKEVIHSIIDTAMSSSTTATMSMPCTVIRLLCNCMIVFFVLRNCCHTSHSFSLPIIPQNRKSLLSNNYIFTTFQFDSNGICVVPKLFIEERQQQQQTSEHPLRYYTMQNVPGDGDCIFLAVALATVSSMGYWNYNTMYTTTGNMHNTAGVPASNSNTSLTDLFGTDDLFLRTVAYNIRNVVADILQTIPPPNDCRNRTLLHITQTRTISTVNLLQQASYELKITPTQYISLLRKEGRHNGLFGGGPELTILSNILRRPITIYEIDYNKTTTTSHTENNSNSNDYSNYIDRNDNIIETPITIDSDAMYIVAKGTFGEGVFHDPLSSCNVDSNNNNQDNTTIIHQISNWHLNVLIVDVSDHTKHACVLYPQHPSLI
jgi:hypothetical protein